MKKICALSLVFLVVVNMILTAVTTAASSEEEIDLFSKGVVISTSSLSPDPPTNAFDTRPLTVFRTKDSNNYNGDWIRLDFKEEIVLNCVEFYESFDNVVVKYDYSVERFMIQCSNDGNEWETIYFGNEIGLRKEAIFPTVKTKHVRFVFRGKAESRITLATIKLFYKPLKENGNEIGRASCRERV